MIGGGHRMLSVMLTRAILDSHHPPWPRLPWRGCRGLATSAPASSSKQRNLYTVLGVAATAETKEIKENFYKLSKEFHPDVNKDESSLKKFREIVEAYEVLSSPGKRTEYDVKMGFKPASSVSSGSTADYHNYTGTATGSARRYPGMKGEFRNGRFVDEERQQEFRNIQYDLDPEKMERIWKRYKMRWDRLDEIEREKTLLQKKIEFRRRMDLKREKMYKNLMSKEEKEEFMYRIRLHRPDAVEDFDVPDHEFSEEFKSETKKSSTENNSDTNRNHSSTSFESGKRREKSPPPKNDDFDQDTRNILKNHFGMSDEELDRLDIGKGFKKDSQGANTGGDMDFKHDPLFTGMKDTSKDATNWRDFLKKASKNTNEKWEQLKNDRVDSPQNSKRYSIEEDKHGEKFVLLLLLIAASLMYNEFKYN